MHNVEGKKSWAFFWMKSSEFANGARWRRVPFGPRPWRRGWSPGKCFSQRPARERQGGEIAEMPDQKDPKMTWKRMQTWILPLVDAKIGWCVVPWGPDFCWPFQRHGFPGPRRLTCTGSGPIADEHRDMEVEEDDDDYEAFLASVFVGRGKFWKRIRTYIPILGGWIVFFDVFLLLLGIFHDLLVAWAVSHLNHVEWMWQNILDVSRVVNPDKD